MSIESMTYPPLKQGTARQVARWWDEAETAIHARQFARARRFLRWILAVHPDDEEAWLRLAQLASTPGEKLGLLQQAYTLHPDSHRTMAALREARLEQLESAVRELVPRPATLHCLPDQRHSNHNGARSKNGNGPSFPRFLRLVRRFRFWSMPDPS